MAPRSATRWLAWSSRVRSSLATRSPSTPPGKPKTSFLVTQNLPNNEVAIVWPSSIDGSKPAMLPMPGTS